MSKMLIYWILFVMSLGIYGQDNAAFTRDKEFYLKGNATVIGNNILGKSAAKSYDKMDRINDEFKMRYIDIDADRSTWSSSSAFFSIPEESEIVYAGLYWSATYNGESSGERISDNVVFYKKLEERAHNAREIKFKLPNGTYQDIQGSLIYDGEKANNRVVKSRAPYAYTADVTTLMQGYYKGDITVANIAATQGKMNGGSAAGWLLYIVYEDKTQPYQFITTYYGLESIKKDVIEIDFGSFKSSEEGELATYVTMGALEGDANLDKDQVRLYSPKSDLFLPLGNRFRPANNFFNSSITREEDIVLDRKPSSKNTLGFDIAQVKIEDELNRNLANSPQGVKMQFSTRGDHYFLFFTAFQTTISEDFYKEKTQVLKEVVTENSPEIPVELVAEEVAPQETQTEAQTQLETQITPVTESEPIFNEILVKIVDQEAMAIPGLPGGFYIISNVFSKELNAQKWQKTLARKGLTSNVFIRPDNNLYYVSLGNNTDPLIMYEVLKKYREDKDLTKSWILKINI